MSPPEHMRARRQRMSRFRKIMLAVTTAAHVPFLVAVEELMHRVGLGVFGAWTAATALTAAALFLFFGRVQHLAEDWHRPWWQTWLVDLPYFCHWCACIFT